MIFPLSALRAAAPCSRVWNLSAAEAKRPWSAYGHGRRPCRASAAESAPGEEPFGCRGHAGMVGRAERARGEPATPSYRPVRAGSVSIETLQNFNFETFEKLEV